MFSIVQSPTYAVKVEVQMPAEAGGMQTQEFSVIVKRLDSEQIMALADAEKDTKDPHYAIKQVVVDWQDVVAQDGLPWAFNETNFAHMLKVPGVPAAIAQAWSKSIAEAGPKN